MSAGLPIWIMEPELKEKRELYARKVMEGGQAAAHIPEPVDIEDIKQRLREVRRDARDNIGALVEALKANLTRQYPGVSIKTAQDHISAANHIVDISGGIRVISTNNSAIVTQELKPELIAKGFTIVNSYFSEFDVAERRIQDYYDLPRLFDNNVLGTFGVTVKLAGLPDAESRKYIALLGVNAIAAQDGTVFFLEHFSNIHNDLKQASKVVLVVGLDKVVENREEAAFQSRCTGIFGLESILLGVSPRPARTQSITELALPNSTERELHLVLLDNGRTRLLDGEFRDLFLCIGCRACKQHCPIQHSFTSADYDWTPRIYLSQFLSGTSRSIDLCLHCEACLVECPVGIDLPRLMWQAKRDYVARHGVPLRHQFLGRPETLAKLGTAFSPLSNWVVHSKLPRSIMEAATGIDRKTTLPRFNSRTFRNRFKKYDSV